MHEFFNECLVKGLPRSTLSRPSFLIFMPWPYFSAAHKTCTNKMEKLITITKFLVSLQNRLLSGGLELVLSHTKNLCIASYCIQFSTNIKKYNNKLVHGLKN